jgi:uncharacterized protein (TIGR00255 family)
VSERVRRARHEVWVSWRPSEPTPVEARVDAALLAELNRALRAAAAAAALDPSAVGIDLLARFPDVVAIERRGEALPGAARELILACLDEALDAYDRVRSVEGAALAKDVAARFDRLRELVAQAAASAELEPQRILERLKERVAQLVGDPKLDPARLNQEVAFLAERADVTEELVRLRAHLDRARQLLASGDELGKALDFLLQEVGREVNTLGSKARSPETSGLVLQMKAESEKIREQARNLE